MRATTMRPVVSIVIGTYQRLPFLKAAIASVRASQIEAPYEIIVVEGGSADGTIEWLARQRDILTVIQHNRDPSGGTGRKRSWGYFMNLGFKCAAGKYLCLMSDDSVVYPDTIANGVKYFDRERDRARNLGGVAFYWRSWPEEDKYRVGTTLSDKPFVNHGLFLREAVAQVGWIDEDRYGFYCADGDLSLKLWQAGFEVAACEEAVLEHCEHASERLRQANLSGLDRDWGNYLERWTGIFYDPGEPAIGTWTRGENIRMRDPERSFPEWVRLGRRNLARDKPRVASLGRRLMGGLRRRLHAAKHLVVRKSKESGPTRAV